MNRNELTWIISQEHDGMLIRDYLQRIRGFSRKMIKTVKFNGGKIFVNGSIQNVRYLLSTGDALFVQFPEEKIGDNIKPEDMELTIVYEDEFIIVINKPAGIPTIPSMKHPSGTVVNGVLGYYKKNNIPYTVHIVTRLDMNTSGLVLIAKHRWSHSLLSASQKSGKIYRKYKAVIEGHLMKKEGTIDAPIGRKDDSIIKRTVTETGKRAVTHYKVIRELSDHSFIEAELETGRTHQIRVHFSHFASPIAGDDLYGGSTEKIGRQALHCFEISVEHPLTKEMMAFQAPLLEDMTRLITMEKI
ncbi:RluA family pseudouridine synthase [Virgibacillus sp. NKC19-3]|uniref:RluA family pseudouridine synthase n=1 Tax=Virgibacillus saliphilus TaxID=2831674 RepID=UPI001C9AACEE|nr:RluA family pseudouridine synthase [Virgibacillus sp. NKC19-3]MBY7143121.1 RluA family pseudouridine synthase [Virgibacillus sp. NKC19-3]